MAEYDEGYPGDVILRHLLDSPDRVVATVAADLGVEKYRITVKKFLDSLTASSTWLVASVPKALLDYCEERLKWRRSELLGSMRTLGEEEQQEAIQQINAMNNALKEIKKRRDKTN